MCPSYIFNLRILLIDSIVPRNEILLCIFRSGCGKKVDGCYLFIFWLIVTLEEACCPLLEEGKLLVANVIPSVSSSASWEESPVIVFLRSYFLILLPIKDREVDYIEPNKNRVILQAPLCPTDGFSVSKRMKL